MKEVNKINDITKGAPLPRVILSFLSKRVPVAFHENEVQHVLVRTAIEARLASSPWRQLEAFDEQQELLEMKNRGVRYVARVYQIGLL